MEISIENTPHSTKTEHKTETFVTKSSKLDTLFPHVEFYGPSTVRMSFVI